MQRLFAHLPNLKKLHAANSHRPVPSISFDGGGIRPQLRSIDGWSNLAEVFEGRSEIRDLCLNFHDYERRRGQYPSTFNKYPELIRLEIDGEFLPSIAIWLQEQRYAGTLGTLPQLEVLRLTNLWGEAPEGFQVEAWCSLPLTAEMKTEVELLNAVKQRHCPKLCEAQISWGRTWCHGMDGWLPVVRPLI